MNIPSLKRDWKAYYNAVADRPPRKTILTALAAFEKSGTAIALGCGDGRDTVDFADIYSENEILGAIRRSRAPYGAIAS